MPSTNTLPTPERTTSSVSHVRAERRIREIAAALRNSGYSQLRRVQLALDGDRIAMCGKVDSFYLKQLAQEIARESAPGCRVYNSLHVGDNPVR